MAIVECNECGKGVSEEAPMCPHCGAFRKRQSVTVADFNLSSIGFGELFGFMLKVGVLLVPVTVVLSLLAAWILAMIGQFGQ